MEAEDSIGFRVVHAVRGRTRLRVDSPERLADLAQAIEELFHERPGVRDIRVNADCQSVVFSYDADVLDADELLALASGADDNGSWRTSLQRLLGSSVVAAGTSVGHLAEQALTSTRDTARQLARTLLRWPGNGWLPHVFRSAK